jgi:effector-binding domain-containing protein
MDPFADPFNRIGKGWGRIIEWVKENGYEDVSFMPGKYCLEEVKEVDDMTVMDIFVAIE